MRSWNLREVETPGGSRSPVVLEPEESAARAVLIGLEPGQRLGDHEVKEHAFVLVLDGSVEVEAGGESSEASSGTLIRFEPEERRMLNDLLDPMSEAVECWLEDGIERAMTRFNR